jgi:hypothetical protein
LADLQIRRRKFLLQLVDHFGRGLTEMPLLVQTARNRSARADIFLKFV